MSVAWKFTWQEESIKRAVTTRERLKEIKAVCPHACMRVHECVRQSLADFKLAVQDCIELILDHPASAS